MAKNKNSQVKLVLTQLITDIFEKNKNIALNHKQVASKLNLTDGASANTILEILVEETEKGLFIRPERGKFKLKDQKVFITGTVDMTADGSAFIIPDDEFEKDIFVAPRKLRNALNGDKVKVYVFAKKTSGRKKEGEVVEIISRVKTEFIGARSPRIIGFRIEMQLCARRSSVLF